MRLGIIGAGCMGGTLARQWARAGHDIYLGCRGAEGEQLLPGSRRIRVVSPFDAAGADVVVLAVPGSVAPEVAMSLGDLEGRVLIDCTNSEEPIDPSLGWVVAECAINGRVVKALNTIDARVLATPNLMLRPVVPLCGDDDDACDTVAVLTRELGLTPVRFGDLRVAGALEDIARINARMRPTGASLALTILELGRDDEAARRQTRVQSRPVR